MKAYCLGRSEERNPLAVTIASAPVSLSGREVRLGRERTGLPGGSWTRMREGGKSLSGSQHWVTQERGAANGEEEKVLEADSPTSWFCLEPALHLTFPEINLSAKQARAVCICWGLQKPTRCG